VLRDPIRIADAINNPKFHPGDEVILVEGSHKFVRGKFLKLKEDVEWAAIEEPGGKISSHPVEWMRHYPERTSRTVDAPGDPVQRLVHEGHADANNAAPREISESQT
jgi:hypothetical protein